MITPVATDGMVCLYLVGEAHLIAKGAYYNDAGEIVGQAGVFGQYQMFVDHPVGVFFVGQALHFVNGIVFAILYGLIA
ncbi:MAG: hypothetical protein VW552_11530, partial [Ilumatobacter sp.]